MPRFFSSVAYAGRLYVGGVLDNGAWDARALIYWDESRVDAILNERVGDRKVRTAEVLREAMIVSRPHHPAVKLWIAEELEEAAHAIWEGAREEPPGTLSADHRVDFPACCPEQKRRPELRERNWP